MKESRISSIIEEEIEKYLVEVGLCHNTKGHFTDCRKGVVYSLTKKGAEKNNINKDFVKRGTVTSKTKRKPPKVKAKFGINTSKKKSAGRKLIQGDDIPPKYSVLKYPEKYYEEENSPETGLPLKSRYKPSWPSSKKRKRLDRIGKPDRTKNGWIHGKKELDDLAKMKGLYEGITLQYGEVVDLVMSALQGTTSDVREGKEHDRCRSLGFVTVKEAQKNILLALNNFALAQDGKLFSKNGSQTR